MTPAPEPELDPVTSAMEQGRILPVIVMNEVAAARQLGRALVAGGLRMAEVTFRTDSAREVLRAMAQDTDLIVGAGTIVSLQQVDQAIAAGARFIVSPGLDLRIVRRCQEHGVPTFPGVATATDLQATLDLGLRSVKFFPAAALGGLTMLRALAAPFGRLRFIPTGGIGEAQLPEYLSHPAVLAVGGSWMVPPAAVAQADWEQITALTARAVAIAAEA